MHFLGCLFSVIILMLSLLFVMTFKEVLVQKPFDRDIEPIWTVQ